MMKYYFTAFLCFYYWMDFIIICDDVDKPVNELCIKCICHAATGCKHDLPCENNACGGFRIGIPYWIDSGQPTYNNYTTDNPLSFIKCVTNFLCAIHTIQTYMQMHQRDCNGDGRVNCDDFVAIHVLGPKECNNTLPADYENRYNKCKAVYTTPKPSTSTVTSTSIVTPTSTVTPSTIATKTKTSTATSTAMPMSLSTLIMLMSTLSTVRPNMTEIKWGDCK